MKNRPHNTQMFALPRPPAETIALAGATYRLARVFKHDFWAATSLYERQGAVARGEGVPPLRIAGVPPAAVSSPSASSFPPSHSPNAGGSCESETARRGQDALATAWPPEKVVVKIGRVQGFCGFPLDWVGRALRANERAVYRRIEGIPGVARWVGCLGATGYAIEYIDARPLDHPPPPPAGFFDQLRTLFEAIHARGVAYTDSNKRSNILIGADGRPYLVDYQISIRRCDDLPWPIGSAVAAAVRYMAAKDLYHLYKHKRRIAPAELTPEEDSLSRKRGGIHAVHRRLAKVYRAIRRTFLRRQFRKGAIHSPTEDLENHYQPEKDSWRK